MRQVTSPDLKKILPIIVIVAVLAGTAAMWSGRSRRIHVTLPDGSPATGAKIAISHVSGQAVEVGITGSDGTFDMPWKKARQGRDGGWHSVMAQYVDSAGNDYIGQNSERPLKFPMGIRLWRR
jgi:hypothetical protein